MIWNYDHYSKWNTKFGWIYTLWKINIYSKRFNKNHVNYWGNCKYFWEHVAKNLSKIPFYEKIKMTTKGPFVAESIVGLFDCDCNHL
jgi:hypothetical protein